MKHSAFILAVVLYIALLVLNFICAGNYPEYYVIFFAEENTPGEMLSLILYLVCFYFGIQNFRKEDKISNSLTIWFGVSFLEELSIKSKYSVINLQSEFNFHNLPIFHNSTIAHTLYFSIPAILLSIKFYKSKGNSFYDSVLLVLYAMVTLSFLDELYPLTLLSDRLYGEQIEFYCALILCLIMLKKYRLRIMTFVTLFSIMFFKYYSDTSLYGQTRRLFQFSHQRYSDGKSISHLYHYSRRNISLYKAPSLGLFSLIELMHFSRRAKVGAEKLDFLEKRGDDHSSKDTLMNHMIAIQYYRVIRHRSKESLEIEKIKIASASTYLDFLIKSMMLESTKLMNCDIDKVSHRYKYKSFVKYNKANIARTELDILKYEEIKFLFDLHRAIEK